MSSLRIFLFWILLVASACLLVGLDACGGGSTTPPTTPPTPPSSATKIQHVVVIFQENRSTDNLFHDTNLINAGADIASSGLKSDGSTIPLTPISLVTDYDLSHAHKAWVSMYDNGKMDGADQIGIDCIGKHSDCPSPTAWFHYVNPSEVAPYFQLAETYTFGDRMFQTNQGPSFPAHQFIIAGTSAPTPPGTPNSN